MIKTLQKLMQQDIEIESSKKIEKVNDDTQTLITRQSFIFFARSENSIRLESTNKIRDIEAKTTAHVSVSNLWAKKQIQVMEELREHESNRIQFS